MLRLRRAGGKSGSEARVVVSEDDADADSGMGSRVVVRRESVVVVVVFSIKFCCFFGVIE